MDRLSLRLFFCSWLCLALTAGAMGPRPAFAGGSDFWSELAYPGQRRYLQELQRGKKLEAQADEYFRRRSSPVLVRRLREDALGAYERALGARPGGGVALHRKARLMLDLGKFKAALPIVRSARQKSARARWDKDLAFMMGVAHSKLGVFRKSVDEYDRYEQICNRHHRCKRYGRATAHANAAEALMALGRLDEAILRYRLALSYQGGMALSHWGLGVALDRDEQVSKAMTAIRRALRTRKGMGELFRSSVFFVPKGDIHYYVGLGHLASGKHAEARKAFTAYLKALPKSPWAVRARAHLEALGKTSRRKDGKKRLAPVPAARHSTRDLVAQDRRRYRNAVRSSYYTFRNCYRAALRTKRGLSGSLRLRFVVAAKRPRPGFTRSVRVLSDTLRSPRLKSCVIKRIKRYHFGRPSGKKDVVVIVPLEFRQG